MAWNKCCIIWFLLVFTQWMTQMKSYNYTSTLARSTACSCGKRESQVALSRLVVATSYEVAGGKRIMWLPLNGGVGRCINMGVCLVIFT